ncbi:MAG TPA: hypothetical protein P5252_06185, partial [Candidatus Cloacimonas sp.]|nr:hypothetical protein [Candidatus Cloacimonas sp.]
ADFNSKDNTNSDGGVSPSRKKTQPSSFLFYYPTRGFWENYCFNNPKNPYNPVHPRPIILLNLWNL